MTQSTSIKELRANLAQIANAAESGTVFEVYRRSKPSFKIVPIDTPLENEWETVVDFTKGNDSNGLNIDTALEMLK